MKSQTSQLQRDAWLLSGTKARFLSCIFFQRQHHLSFLSINIIHGHHIQMFLAFLQQSLFIDCFLEELKISIVLLISIYTFYSALFQFQRKCCSFFYMKDSNMEDFSLCDYGTEEKLDGFCFVSANTQGPVQRCLNSVDQSAVTIVIISPRM